MTTCRHFDREGLARAERGAPDPHVDGCADCQAARADYERVRAAIGESGAAFTPRAGWEERVLATIDRTATAAPVSRRGWWLAGGAIAAAAAAVLWWRVGRTPPRSPAVAQFEVVHGSQILRGGTPAVGDGWRVTNPGDRAAIWIYRGERLTLACARVEDPNSTGNRNGTCTLSAGAAMADLEHLSAATYHAIALQTELRAPATLDEALALVTRAGIPHVDREIVVE